MAMIYSEMVQLKADGDGARAFVARPDDAAQHPGVVMIQEWWGLEPHIKDMAQKLAVEGFVVVVPDFYNGKIATEPSDAQKSVMMIAGNLDRAISMVRGALDWLRDQPFVEPKQFGIVGFCVGGFVTYLAAERLDDIAVAVPFYAGGYDPNAASVAGVDAPILAIYGDKDDAIPQEQREKIQQLYEAAGKDYEQRTYPAGHAFLNPDHGMGHEASAKEAWPRAVHFLRRHLEAVEA